MEEMVVFLDGLIAWKSIREATSRTILKVARFNHPTWFSVDVFSQSPPTQAFTGRDTDDDISWSSENRVLPN